MHPGLDNPVLTALSGPQAGLAEVAGSARRYPVDVAPFLGLPSQPTEQDWEDAAQLVGVRGRGVLLRTPLVVPASWRVVRSFNGVQMTDAGLVAGRDSETVALGAADVPEMLELVARTRPGPFLPRTVALGTYLGIRRGGVLVAMAGERMRLPGWTEISAVCTDDSVRGQGLGTRLIKAVASGVHAGGGRLFLHAAAANVSAIGLYTALGFAVRRELVMSEVGVRT